MWGPRLNRRLVAAMLAALVVTTVGPAPVPASAGGLPACTIGDTLTRYRNPSDWYRALLDTELKLRSSHVPPDLVNVARSGASGGGRIRKIALKDFTAMVRAAKRAGATFAVESAYRSYATQNATFWGWVARSGYDNAILASARAGHSEHQLGTAVDLKSPGGAAPWAYRDWGTTRPGKWLARHSWRYGWVLSYPEDPSPRKTCYKYEPWHFRYVGRELAERVHDSGMSLRQWLWKHGAGGTWTGGSPNPTPTPTPDPSPNPTPTPDPDPTPTPTPDPTAEPAPDA